MRVGGVDRYSNKTRFARGLVDSGPTRFGGLVMSKELWLLLSGVSSGTVTAIRRDYLNAWGNQPGTYDEQHKRK